MRCDACKRKTLEVLNSICGVYSLTFDAEEGLAKISGEVNPNILLSALARTGQHAEIVWAKLNHPRIDRGYYNDNDSYGQPYRYSDWHRRALTDSSYNPNYYYDATPLPAARYIPAPEYAYVEDQSMSFCSIM
ncbi:heavy metal-associated isoprenylated plant protein 32 [Abeliophyllum distichum]|uniref:Heavy metal-associated isoprenylated plant protein 32 n=1 Tax=Abeliophyllum distichum TaxID=126358 RepID=A0ABD1P9I2_9LAMI